MIRSMTGYGKGECTLYSRRFIVEIKSVNHRYSDITIKLPRIMNSFEEKIRKTLGKAISRGKADVYISFETFSKEDVKLTFQEALSDAYVDELEKIRKRYSLEEKLSLSLIARIPDIIAIDKNIADEKALSQMEEALFIAVNDALCHFVDMRSKEGESLKTDILQKIDGIALIVEQIRSRAPFVANEHREKLKARLSEALADVAIDEDRLIMEAAIFADKACVDEEITRLFSHIEQMRGIFREENAAIGRKLDFLVQEMNREVNTIGSKSNDILIAQHVIELKSEIEKIREQVQNIE